eukprot:7863819-Pyramimonas_sp.AAC.1
MTARVAWGGNFFATGPSQVAGQLAPLARGWWWATVTKRGAAVIRIASAECSCLKCFHWSPNNAPNWSQSCRVGGGARTSRGWPRSRPRCPRRP